MDEMDEQALRGKVIAVTGPSGAGKSTFIRAATSDQPIWMRRGPQSNTQNVSAHPIEVDNQQLVLLHTSSFDNMNISDAADLRAIVNWLAKIHGGGGGLTAILYLHSMLEDSMSQISKRNLAIFLNMVGQAGLPYVVFVTTMWNRTNEVISEEMESTLPYYSDFLDVMMSMTGHVARFNGTKESAYRIIQSLLHNITTMSNIQNENLGYQQRSPGNESRNEGPAGITKLRPRVGSHGGSESQPSIYERLDPGNIRLVDLLYGEGEQPVSVRLLTMPFADDIEFEALSYSVGRPENTATLRVRHRNRTEGLVVSARLESMLRHLRYPKKDRRLWIDAVSINQFDLEERAAEVRRIGKIFAKAQNVCIWLGDSTEDSDLAIDFIPEVLDFEAFDRIVQDDSMKRHWLALAKLMAREWFTRRWVVQEMALARRASVHCGTRIISWSDMAAAATLFGTHWAEIIRRLSPMEAFMFGDVQNPGATSLVELSTKVLRKRDQAWELLQRQLSLEELLTFLPIFEVTVHLDAIYSIIDIAHDTYGTTTLSVDYNLNPAALFSEVIDFIIKTSGSMDIICRPWAPISSDLPSYISTVSNYAFERREDGQYHRQNADTLTGSPRQRFYWATGNSSPEHVMGIESGRRRLECKSVPLGQVLHLEGRSVNANVPWEWRKLAGWLNRSRPVPEHFWRTLVADRGPGGTNPPNWYANACTYSFRRAGKDMNITEMLKISSSFNERQFLRRVQATVWNRTFFTMKDNEGNVSFGLGPADTKLGDKIAIIYGCSVPVVLREARLGSSWSNENSSYTLVGECFVLGYMEGEAIRKKGKNEAMTLTII